MNAVDGSEHYERQSDVILDTNPRAWGTLAETLPLSKVIANIIVFINAHLAFNYANKVAVLASHPREARWLYPTPSKPASRTSEPNGGEVQMTGTENGRAHVTADDANKYRPFRLIEDEVMRNLRALMDDTSAKDIAHNNSTMMAGAMTLALSYINKQTIAHGDSANNAGSNDAKAEDPAAASQGLQSRILIISVSSDLAFQYIPVMNCIFAAQRRRIPIDVLKLSTPSTFLQQAADATHGIYLTPTAPHGLLQYLMQAFLPDATARAHLVLPTQVDVDFRAACFCHKRVVDTGFVCSICLSSKPSFPILI
ncbi:MAG: General transcription factor IIH subunit 3 [Thelocarpon impressellum]|nr:MAG: General transcription factor IIH subunit 3 [Thelocarpon impressellum]